jgi:hypothetical protein
MDTDEPGNIPLLIRRTMPDATEHSSGTRRQLSKNFSVSFVRSGIEFVPSISWFALDAVDQQSASWR